MAPTVGAAQHEAGIVGNIPGNLVTAQDNGPHTDTWEKGFARIGERATRSKIGNAVGHEA